MHQESEDITNGKLLKKINDSVVRLETQQIANAAALVEIKKILTSYNDKCDKTCEKNENRFGRLFTHIKIQWVLLGAIAAGIIKLAFF